MRLAEKIPSRRLWFRISTAFSRGASPKPTSFILSLPSTLSEDAKRVQRQAFAGLLWSKQYYHFVVNDWLKGDPDAADSAARAAEGARFAVGAFIQRRRYFDAGYLGISVVSRRGTCRST